MLRLYNTLTKKIESVTPSLPKEFTLYCCGPTVYDYAHIGNFRTYTMTDILVRVLRYEGNRVHYVMNITDVGHLVSDSDLGEDKLEKGSKREGKSAWDIAKFYTDAFLSDSAKINLVEPDLRPKPTDHIHEQVDMVKTLVEKGYGYVIDDGIYFDTSKSSDYGILTGQKRDELKEGARVEINDQKRNPTDFALWKFSYPKGRDFDPKLDDIKKRRQMEWPSPWGLGFPGWHIECSAMSRKYLGDQIDIHTGGADLIPIHHTNEIVQSEAATGVHPFVRFWVHGQFMMVDNEKMSKSKGNFYRLQDIVDKGFDPLALRYFYMTSHYRSFLNFTWTGLDAASKGLEQVHMFMRKVKAVKVLTRNELSNEKLVKIDTLRKKFTNALENDLNMPQALAVIHETIKSNIPDGDKNDLILEFDEVLGLGLKDIAKNDTAIPGEISELLKIHEQYRKNKDFKKSDEARKEIELKGFEVKDTPAGAVAVKSKL
ncbi:cysteine--tRNA ligase [Candidatus Gottesmanbacteria bacterium]|nr:cysteine--tRNA ligase [Candidatus Gottesmanbacteria bacterium]